MRRVKSIKELQYLIERWFINNATLTKDIKVFGITLFRVKGTVKDHKVARITFAKELAKEIYDNLLNKEK